MPEVAPTLHLAGVRKKALVTGGATGRSALLGLARAGYDVAINYASSVMAAQAVASEAEALGAKAMLLRWNVGAAAAVLQMLAKVAEWFGHLAVDAASLNVPSFNELTPPLCVESRKEVVARASAGGEASS